MNFNIANTLTGFRIAAIPLFVILFYLPVDWARKAAVLIFAAAAITDWLDGWVARKLDQMTPFGAFLDPVADKLIVAVALVLLAETDGRWIVAIIAAIIIGREITVSALREWMATEGASATVKVSRIGKFKTTFQLIGLPFMIWRDDLFGLPIYELGFLSLLIAAGLTLWSMFLYLRAAWPVLMRGE